VCRHRSVSLNNERVVVKLAENKIAVCEKTAGLGCGNFSDLNSACSKVFVPVKIFQFKDMLNENRFLGTFREVTANSLLEQIYITYDSGIENSIVKTSIMFRLCSSFGRKNNVTMVTTNTPKQMDTSLHKE
jgi:hypothetical protein